jgi:DNA-binding NarL/FixJ family response regulator
MKVLVVDDHVLIREALRDVLKELRSDAVVLESSDGAQAMQLIAHDIGLVLLDLNLPDRDGFSMLVELSERYPATSVVVLSGQQDRETVIKALDLGALGFIPKSAERKVMLAALELVFAGGIYIPPEILPRREPAPIPVAPQPDVVDSLQSLPHDLGLTQRQREVLAHMVRGASNKDISRALDMAEATVKNHISAILRALKVTNRTEAVIVVIESGWNLPPAS